jgi:hypothetical protein
MLSLAAVGSMWVGRELKYVLRQKRYENRIVPVMLNRCNAGKLSWVLPDLQIIDMHSLSSTAFESLLRIWNMDFDRRKRPKTAKRA